MSRCTIPRDGGLITIGVPRDIIHRFEKINTNIFASEELAINQIADEITKSINDFNKEVETCGCSRKVFNLGLSTGKTPIHLYQELVKRYKNKEISFKNVAIYSLDEFYPILSTQKQSRNFVIHEQFINHVDIQKDNVKVISQPMGTLLSIATLFNGMLSTDAEKYFKSKLLVFDPGFGTADYFPIKNSRPAESQTFDNLGMKQVLYDVSEQIKKKYNIDIPVPAFQPFLETGKVNQFDRKKMKSKSIDFSDILEECSKSVCMQNIEKMKELYNYLQEMDYLVITGGCGAAWSSYIRDYFSDMENLTIISGNQNDKLPYIFSTVRGYYMFMIQSLRK